MYKNIKLLNNSVFFILSISPQGFSPWLKYLVIYGHNRDLVVTPTTYFFTYKHTQSHNISILFTNRQTFFI